METLISIFPILLGVSTISTLIAFFFLQSRATGLSRVLIISGALISIIPALSVGFIKIEDRDIIHGLIAAGGTNVGIILLSVGITLFSISLPSRRLNLKAEDKRSISSQIVKEIDK